MGNCWRIEFAERPLKVGILDNLIFGKDASHSFLRLIDEDGNIASELHGYSYDTKKKALASFSLPIINDLKNIFSDAASKNDEIKVFHYEGQHDRSEKIKTKTVFMGNEEEVRARWIVARHKAAEIDQAAYEYCPLRFLGFGTARNCHTVSATLMRAMRVSIPPSHYATPGLTNSFDVAAKSNPLQTLRDKGARYIMDIQNTAAQWGQSQTTPIMARA